MAGKRRNSHDSRNAQSQAAPASGAASTSAAASSNAAANSNTPTPDTGTTPEMFRVCRIGRAQGLKGEVNVTVFTDEPERRFAPGSVLYDAAGNEFTVERSRTFRERWIVLFRNVTDRNASEALNGTELFCPADSEEEMEAEDAWYPDDLIGLDVYVGDSMETARKIGTVDDVLDSPAQFLLEVLEDADGKRALVPFVEQIVPEIDLENNIVRLTPPDGLL